MKYGFGSMVNVVGDGLVESMILERVKISSVCHVAYREASQTSRIKSRFGWQALAAGEIFSAVLQTP